VLAGHKEYEKSFPAGKYDDEMDRCEKENRKIDKVNRQPSDRFCAPGF